ncbi:MAG: hypothetical protein H7Z42_05460 [Roseiflexaceae bacterium]|nr:hypothetical protein [Roseiflexaceae bacterium]
MIQPMTTIPYTSQPHERLEIATVLLQVERSLLALQSVASQIDDAAMPRHAIPMLFERVDFNARRAEDGMRLLRDLNIARDAPATELSQSLTVVVLVADMVVSGHLSPASLADDELFLPNLARAQTCLRQLKASLDAE